MDYLLQNFIFHNIQNNFFSKIPFQQIDFENIGLHYWKVIGISDTFRKPFLLHHIDFTLKKKYKKFLLSFYLIYKV